MTSDELIKSLQKDKVCLIDEVRTLRERNDLLEQAVHNLQDKIKEMISDLKD